MADFRTCRQCGKLVDFSDPYCDHETMEESAWIDMRERREKAVAQIQETLIDDTVARAAKELGYRAGQDMAELRRKQLG